MASENRLVQDQNWHIRIAATCLIIYGVIRLVAAVWLVSFTNTATVMFGALLNRVPDPFQMMSLFHTFYAFAVVLSLACGVIGILAGWALLAGQRSGQTLAIAAAFLSLSDIPLGLTLGVYCLIVFLQLPAGYRSTEPLDNHAPDLRHDPSVM